jgi:hypothetical protein
MWFTSFNAWNAVRNGNGARHLLRPNLIVWIYGSISTRLQLSVPWLILNEDVFELVVT